MLLSGVLQSTIGKLAARECVNLAETLLPNVLPGVKWLMPTKKLTRDQDPWMATVMVS